MTFWYPASAMTIPHREVWVRWGWLDRPFKAMLAETKPRKWAKLEPRKNKQWEVVWLPPQRVVGGFVSQRTTGEMVSMTDAQREVWGPEPDAWRPIGEWPEQLPEPLLAAAAVSDEIRMVSIGKVSFDAAAAAAEMEGDREDARRNRREPRETVNLAWWRDASRIKYLPAGEITREMAEGRVMRAVSWCSPGADLSVGSMATSQFLARMAAMTLLEALAAQEDMIEKAVRFEPLRQDHEDFGTAMGWFVRLNQHRANGITQWDSFSREQDVMLYRARTVPLSYADIGRQFGISGERSRFLYERAIDKVAALANAPATVDLPVLAVRERNRAHKRASA